jgi:nicotinic acid mononucleotide adenylyltransferase
MTMCRTHVTAGYSNSEVCLPGNRMRYELYMELRKMAVLQERLPCEEPFGELYQRGERALTHIDMLMRYGHIQPARALQSGSDHAHPQDDQRPLRIGVYPITANPLHWAHVLIGLEAMAKLRLDRVVYIIAGYDARKHYLIDASLRYRIARSLLKSFEPYLCCSDIALGTDHDGETNLIRLLQLNQEQPINAVYIAGADHYRRVYPDGGYVDTIAKLERFCELGLFNTDSSRHTVQAAFIMRGHQIEPLQTNLPTCFLDGLPFSISSTIIRAALRGDGSHAALAFLPYRVYAAVRALSLYRPTGPTLRHRAEPGLNNRVAAMCV